MADLSLSQRQRLFAKYIGQLLTFIYANGWEVTFGDFWRPDKQGHMDNSVHYVRLAADLNLWVGGLWKQSDCPEWQTVGRFWKSLNPDLCAWGGDFKQVDLNHVSLKYQGRA